MAFMGSHYLEESRINIARGLVKGTSFIHKFGASPNLSNNVYASIWDVPDALYPWASLTTASTLTIDCASPSDVGDNILLYGLDANYNEIQETVPLSAQTGNTTSNQFLRVYRAAFIDGGVENVGNINIKVGATTVARITANKGQTLMAIYTVPAGYTGYLVKGTASVGPTYHVTCDMYARYYGQANFRVGHAFELTGGQYLYEFAVPLPLPEKTDIDVRGTMVSGNNVRVTAAFDIILVQNK